MTFDEFKNGLEPVRKFLRDIVGSENTYFYWKAKKYREHFENKVFKRGPVTLDDRVVEWMYKSNAEWKEEIFFSLHPNIYVRDGYKLNGRKRKWRKGTSRSFVVDIDCGTSDETVKESALEKSKGICSFLEIPYTHLVRSRNGFHMYWATDGIYRNFCGYMPPVEHWSFAQKRLAQVFGGDTTICSPQQDMRLPGTLHWKGNENGYAVKVEATGVPSYSCEGFLKTLGLESDIDAHNEIFGYPYNYIAPPTPKIFSLLTSVPDKKPTSVQEIPDFSTAKSAKSKSNPLSHTSERSKKIWQALDEVKSDRSLLESYLGVKDGCKCPFHKDDHPSTEIYESSNGAWLFSCYSPNCELTKTFPSKNKKIGTVDIVTAVQFKEKLNGVELVKRVLDIAGRDDLKFKEIEWKGRDNLKYLDRNLKFLDPSIPPSSFVSIYTTKRRNFKWLVPFLSNFIKLAKTRIKNPDNKFPARLKDVAKATKSKSQPQSSKKLYLCRLAGFIHCTSVPEALREADEKFKNSKGRKNGISWHRIPEWSEDTLRDGLKILEEAYNNGINTKHCTREKINEVFGWEAEARVFFGDSDFINPNGLKDQAEKEYVESFGWNYEEWKKSFKNAA